MGINWLDYWDPSSLPGFVDWLGFIIGSAGIIFAVVQLRRSAGALRAAKIALDETRDDLIYKRLTASIPDLYWLTANLGKAIDGNQRPVAAYALEDLSRRIAEVRSLFKLTENPNEALLEKLLSGTSDLSSIRGQIYDDPTKSLHSIVGGSMVPLRDLMAEVNDANITVQSAVEAARRAPRGTQRRIPRTQAT